MFLQKFIECTRSSGTVRSCRLLKRVDQFDSAHFASELTDSRMHCDLRLIGSHMQCLDSVTGPVGYEIRGLKGPRIIFTPRQRYKNILHYALLLPANADLLIDKRRALFDLCQFSVCKKNHHST
jgi:hypothetical protein